MQHLRAAQLADGRWYYVSSNSRGGGKIGYCSGLHLCDEDHQPFSQEELDCVVCEGRGLVPDENPCQGHDTAEEACEHYKQYQLDHNLRLYPDKDLPVVYRCSYPGCVEFTSGTAVIGGYTLYNLCKEHRTKDHVAELYSVGESWES